MLFLRYPAAVYRYSERTSAVCYKGSLITFSNGPGAATSDIALDDLAIGDQG